MKQQILPSVMGKSQKEINTLFKKLNGVAKHLHLDVADGKFVPNTSLWFPFRLSTKFTYSVHLMVKNPLPWIRKHGHKMSGIIFHPEPLNTKNDLKAIKLIRQKRRKVGIALKPETKVSSIHSLLPIVDYVIILTVHPGFYGARYLKSPLKKIKQIKKLNSKIKVIVDGHMDSTTIKQAKSAGADYFVSGSFISKSENPKKAMRELKKVIS
jgi:ribulose-phosphate 3-epimerase